MSNRIALGREAMRSALQLRRSLSIAREDAINVYDIATAVGVDVLFLDRPSLEGMFVRDPDPVVLLPSRQHRPRGRISFSCAHELGHFHLGHGTKVDEYIEGDATSSSKSDEEYAADTFASSLLMPRQAVLQRFVVRDYRPIEADPTVLFAIAGELDVGYSTLIKHMRYGLEMVTDAWFAQRQRTTPKQIKEHICGSSGSTHLVVVGPNWPKVPVDLEVNDVIAVPAGTTIQKPALLTKSRVTAAWQILVAMTPGLGHFQLNGVTHSVRVARAAFCGPLKYRFLDDPEAE